MLIILRAVTFGFLSSFSFACVTWQYSHSTPREAAMNCIEGITCSAGIPFRAWIFLNSSSASLAPAWIARAFGGLDCAHAPATAGIRLSEVPQIASQKFGRFLFTNFHLASSVTKALAT